MQKHQIGPSKKRTYWKNKTGPCTKLQLSNNVRDISLIKYNIKDERELILVEYTLNNNFEKYELILEKYKGEFQIAYESKNKNLTQHIKQRRKTTKGKTIV